MLQFSERALQLVVAIFGRNLWAIRLSSSVVEMCDVFVRQKKIDVAKCVCMFHGVTNDKWCSLGEECLSFLVIVIYLVHV